MIVTVAFKEPWPRPVPGLLQFGQPMIEFINEVTIHTDETPRVVHFPDGHKRGYLRVDYGVEFAVKDIAGYRVIL